MCVSCQNVELWTSCIVEICTLCYANVQNDLFLLFFGYLSCQFKCFPRQGIETGRTVLPPRHGPCSWRAVAGLSRACSLLLGRSGLGSQGPCGSRAGTSCCSQYRRQPSASSIIICKDGSKHDRTTPFHGPEYESVVGRGCVAPLYTF